MAPVVALDSVSPPKGSARIQRGSYVEFRHHEKATDHDGDCHPQKRRDSQCWLSRQGMSSKLSSHQPAARAPWTMASINCCAFVAGKYIVTYRTRCPTAKRNKTPPASAKVESELTPIADARCAGLGWTMRSPCLDASTRLGQSNALDAELSAAATSFATQQFSQ
jgi:hypothetical protein